MRKRCTVLILMLRKKEAKEVIEKEAERLKTAMVKIELARNIVNQVRKRKDPLLFESAIVGIPASSRNIANLYIDSAFNDIEKTVKTLKKVERKMAKKKINHTREKIHSIAVELETTAHEETPQTITLKLQKAVMELEELAKVLRGKVAVKT